MTKDIIQQHKHKITKDVYTAYDYIIIIWYKNATNNSMYYGTVLMYGDWWVMFSSVRLHESAKTKRSVRIYTILFSSTLA